MLRCIVCHTPFDFAAGETPLILRHVAYDYDFVHDDKCLATAREWIFPEPDYDCAAFARDPERRRVLNVTPGDGWAVVLPNSRVDPLQCWVTVEHRDGSTVVEALVRDAEWLDEPGGAEFPRHVLGFTSRLELAA